MNTLKGLSLAALLIAGSMSFVSPTQANTEAITEAPTQAIEAPLTDLSYPSTTITTSPAPTTEAPITEAPTQAPTQAIVEAPTAPILEAPLTAPLEAPTEAVTEQPTAAPEAPTAAPTDPYSGNPIVNCAAQGLLTAEDSSCVPQNYYDTVEVGKRLESKLSADCENLALGDAYAGIMRWCHYQDAILLEEMTLRGLKFLDSGFEPRADATFWVRSAKYPEIIYSYTDGLPLG